MTNNNLYNNLHKRSSGWDEDFLTEALVHLVKFLQELEPKACYKILNILTNNLVNKFDAGVSEISISTQLSTKHGIPDICIKHSDFMVFIEVKVDADFHKGQLEGYKVELNQSGNPNTRLNTLTRYGQTGDNPDVNVAFRWNQIADWLEQLVLTHKVAIFLRNEFVGFLKQRGVAMDKVEWDLVSGVKSFISLLNMIMEAMVAAHVKHHAVSPAKDWYGYYRKYDEPKKIFVGIYFTNPSRVYVQTEGFKLDDDLEVTKGEVVNGQWTETLDLSSEEVHFFARSKQSQLACLEEFIGDSVRYAEQFVINQTSVQ